MKIESIRKLLAENNSKFFSVEFIKKDGTKRKINGNLRYAPGHDGQNTVADREEYLTVVLPQKDEKGRAQFRNVNLSTVKTLTVGGKTYTWENKA